MKMGSARLLFVGNEGEFLRQLQKSLPQDCSLDIAESAADAAAKLRLDEPDILIVNTETRVNQDFLNAIHEEYPCIVCVALIADSQTENGIFTVPAAAFDFLAKPFNLHQFWFCLKRAMEHRQALIAERDARDSMDRLSRRLSERIKCATRELLVFNEHLNNANRAKDSFLAAMSHELRTPLTAITGGVRILQSPRITEEKARTILEMLDRNVATLKRLLDDLFDCSRIASGTLSLEMVPTSLNECVAAAVETMRAKAADAQVQLHALIPETPFTVNGNPLRLQQIAWNLIDNAIKFTSANGHIAVSISHNGDSVELMVCDSGIGLSPADKETIFEPFAQGQAGRKGGLGLGLSLVRSLTKIHNGSVRAESDGPGSGSRFIVTLPLTEKGCPVHHVA